MLTAATYTPLHPDGSPNLAAIPRMAGLLAGSGVEGVFVAGTTGESLSLSVTERMQLAEAWVEPARAHGLRLLVHVGTCTGVDAVALARHADKLGVDAISAMAPSYFKPATCADLAAYLADIATAAPHTPFYYYDIPSLTGVTFRSSDILLEHAHRIPGLAGIKYTSSDIVDFERCSAAADGRFHMYWGTDEALVAGLALGAAGAIGSTYNYCADWSRAVIAAFRAGDLSAARRAQKKVVDLVDAIARYGYLRASKALMSRLGVDCGPVRPPLRPLSEGEFERLLADCAAVGFHPDASSGDAGGRGAR